MDATLATVTIISLLLAWAMAIVTWQRIRAERRRADARVAGVMAELARDPAPPARGLARRERGWPIAAPAAMAAKPLRRRRPAPAGPPVESRLPFTASDAAPADRGEVPRSREYGEGGGRRSEAGGVFPHGLPARLRAYLWQAVVQPEPSAPPHWGHRLAAVAIATVLVAGVSLANRTPAAAMPVELLSLDHRRQGDYLAVSGSLRNPRGGKERAQLSITATVFDRAGAIVGTGQTPLPVAVLPPGGETAFTISLPDADQINRYRVSFMEDHSRLPHVDRRQSDATTDAAMPASAETRP